MHTNALTRTHTNEHARVRRAMCSRATGAVALYKYRGGGSPSKCLKTGAPGARVGLTSSLRPVLNAVVLTVCTVRRAHNTQREGKHEEQRTAGQVTGAKPRDPGRNWHPSGNLSPRGSDTSLCRANGNVRCSLNDEADIAANPVCLGRLAAPNQSVPWE
eukprot:gene25166-biopygen1430